MPSTVIGLMKGIGDRLTDVDDAFLHIVGYQRAEFERGEMNWRVMTPPEFLHLDDAGIQQALRADSGGFTMPYRKEFVRRDGSRVPVLICCAFVPEAAPGTWMGYAVDLSVPDPQHAHRLDASVALTTVEPSSFYARLIGELVRERTRLLAIVDNTTSMMWSVDRSLHLMTANAAFHRSISRAIGRTLSVGELVLAPEYPAAIRDQWRAWYDEVLAGKPLVTHTAYVTGGVETAFAHVLTPFRSAQGEILGVSGVSHDVTARTAAERRAQEREQELLEAQRLARIGTWDWDAGTDGVTWSDSLRELFGWPDGEPAPAFAQHAHFYSDVSWEQLQRAVQHTAQTGEPFELELALRADAPAADVRAAAGAGSDPGSTDALRAAAAAPARPRWILARGERRLDAQHRFAGLHGVVMDVTERHEADEARRRLESQLLQSQKMQALGQLAGGVAHDFNNILTSVLLQVGTMREEVQDLPVLASSVEEVERSARRACSLTRQLLMFSRRQAPDLRLVDVNALLHDFLRMLRRLIGEQYTIDFDAGALPLRVLGDRGMLEQVVMNLTVNARDAMAPGGHVTIHTGLVQIAPAQVPNWPGASAGTFVEIRVSDTGCGIAPELHDRIFEPFFTTKQAGKGTGLGLATTYGIVAQHGGWVEFSSVPGAGTTFVVRLPAHAEMLGDAGATVPRTRAPQHAPPARGRILLVEDEPSVRSLVEQALVREGYHVTAVADADHALRCFGESGPFDLVLSDIMLPGAISGIELVGDLRTRQPGLRTLLMTGYAEEMGAPDFAARAGGPVLQKPFDVPELLEAIERIMTRVPALT